jgi:hypothetical protein
MREGVRGADSEQAARPISMNKIDVGCDYM